MSTLYPWTHADHVAADEILRHKAPYLNTPFFLVRARDLLRRLDAARRRC